jgi:hypothetical protein
VALTAFSTMGTGEHYFIDLVVAFPFVLFLQALCTTSLNWTDSRRLMPFLFGLITILVWLWALRFHPQVFWYSPLIPWLCCVLTIGVTEITRRGLMDAAVGLTAHSRIASPTPASAIAAPAR